MSIPAKGSETPPIPPSRGASPRLLRHSVPRPLRWWSPAALAGLLGAWGRGLWARLPPWPSGKRPHAEARPPLRRSFGFQKKLL